MTPVAANKAIFLDRDGTLIYDKHYLSDPADVEVIPGVGEALQKALNMGYALFLFSNQSGVGRGYFTLDAVGFCNQRMVELMGFAQSPFLETCLADEAPDQPIVYRKPSPKFIYEMIAQYQLDTTKSYMVGDKVCDWEAGIRADIQSVAVQTGKPFPANSAEFLQTHNVPVYHSVVEWIAALSRSGF